MVQIKSTIGASHFDIPKQQKRLVIPNAEEQQEIEQVSQNPRIPQARSRHDLIPGAELNPAVVAGMRKQAQEQAQISEQRSLGDARRRIELITGLGRKTRDVDVEFNNESHRFTLRTLKTFEQNFLDQTYEDAKRISLSDGRIAFSNVSYYHIKIEALSHSLFLIDGQSIDLVLGTANEEYQDQVLARKDLLREMDVFLITHLFEEYEKLCLEAHDGYAPRTDDEMKEVVNTISKSGQNT